MTEYTFEENVARVGSNVDYNVGEARLPSFFQVFPNILFAIGKIREIGCCVNPDITRLGFLVDDFVIRRGGWRCRSAVVRVVARTAGGE